MRRWGVPRCRTTSCLPWLVRPSRLKNHSVIQWISNGSTMSVACGCFKRGPSPVLAGPRPLTNDDCEWSRANFKETLPELPSPLGLSFLEQFMERHILSPYRRMGCQIPEGVSSVRTFKGRPYINMTLFYSLIAQLRGDPSLMTEQMGGEILVRPPAIRPLGWFALARAGIVMIAEMRKAVRHGPAWFAEMKAMAAEQRADRLRSLSGEEIALRLDAIAKWLDERELTFAIAGGVAQCLQALGGILPRWLGEDWRGLLNGALQGKAVGDQRATDCPTGGNGRDGSA